MVEEGRTAFSANAFSPVYSSFSSLSGFLRVTSFTPASSATVTVPDASAVTVLTAPLTETS